ncbi:NAD-dependent epimerase/dehydratase family protein [Candidatus Woesearchaeota archaeon]|nr:NAD-dependent epimerase/dehydratase family protein [Candidatus Woesearchaeota archaeon]
MSMILVTGASGCVGANIARRLAEQNHEIHILIQPNTWHPFLDRLKLEIFYGDIRNKKDVIKAMKGCDYVYHVAGMVSYNRIDHKKVYTTNVHGVKTVLESAKELGVKKVVVTASTAGIGIPKNKNKPLNEDAPFDFKRYKKVAYMHSKHLCIKLCQEFAKQGLNVSIVSPTTIYGQGDIVMHIGNVVKKIKQGKLKIAPPGGNAVVSVDDVVDAHLLVMEKGRSGENYIFADEFIPYIYMFNRIAKLLKVQPIKRLTPQWILPYAKFSLNILERTMMVFGKKPLLSPHSINFSFKHRYFDSTKARKELGWEPKVNFEEAMIKAIQFYEDNDLL